MFVLPSLRYMEPIASPFTKLHIEVIVTINLSRVAACRRVLGGKKSLIILFNQQCMEGVISEHDLLLLRTKKLGVTANPNEENKRKELKIQPMKYREDVEVGLLFDSATDSTSTD